MKHRWHPLAGAEYDEAMDYYLLEANPIIGRDFADVVGQVLELISVHPAIGARTHDQTRRTPLHDFPFDLVYRFGREYILVIALASQYRRPGYWPGRR